MLGPAIAVLLPLSLAGCGSLSAHAPRGADLSGEWQLDEKLSDDPRARTPGAPREHRATAPGDPGAMGNPGGMHPHGARGGGHHGGGMWGADRRARNAWLESPANVTVDQKPKEFDLVADGVSTQYSYGEKALVSVRDGTAERIAGWDGHAFEVRFNMVDGPKATRRYELENSGQQLVVTTQVEGGREKTIKFRAVYERAPAKSKV